MLTIEEAIAKFHNELPPLVQSEFGAEEVVVDLKNLEKIYHIPLTPLTVRIAINEISLEKLGEYLEEEYVLPAVRADQLVKELREQIFDPLLERLHFLNKDADKYMTTEQEKNFAERIFRTFLIKELKHDLVVIKAFNDRLFYILSQDEAYSDQLENALYNNTETIGDKDIIVSGQPDKPTIANWLKDYISQYGGQTFDSMSQTNFLLNSENGRKLSEDDRELLAKVLKTYINIKFFPDSMPSDDGKGWEIIPTGEDVEEKIVEKEIKPISESELFDPVIKKPITPFIEKTPAPIPQRTQPVIAPITSQVNINVPSPVSPKPKPEPQPTPSNPDDSEELLNLKNMLLQYPADSLERKAIEEEIKKIEKS